MPKTRVIFIKPIALAAVHIVGPYKDTVPKAWKKIFDWLDTSQNHAHPEQGYGMTLDDPRAVPADQLRYVASVPVPARWKEQDSEVVSRLNFDGGTFARITNHGPYDQIGQVISRFRDEWVPSNGLVFDRTQPLLTVYKSDTRKVAPADQVADICLPVFADRRSKPRD